MAAPPANQLPSITPAEMQILVSRAGLVLNPGQVADLVLAWRQVAGLIASLPRERPLVDDMALTFRLPPPAVAGPQASQRPMKAAAQSRGRRPPVPPPPPARAKRAAKPNAVAKRTPSGGSARKK